MFIHVFGLPRFQVTREGIVRNADRVNTPNFLWLLFPFFGRVFEAFFPVVVRTRFFHDKKSENRPNKLLECFRFENFKGLFLFRITILSRILVEQNNNTKM
ncbi:MAG: hypothetical protein ACTSP9_10905 [Promethearchaeota archaeon]